jgi:hypothetical protein
MQRIHIFRAGKHTPMQGGALSFSEGDLAAMAAAYSPALHEAPIVIGHPAADAPAYGWVGSLTATADGLFAEPRQVDTAFAEMVDKGRFKKVSASFYGPTAPGNPAPGGWYLRHVGFLGAQPPAVKGLKPVEFAGTDEGVVTVEFSDAWRAGYLLGDVAGLFARLRDWLVAEKGVDAANSVLSPYDVQNLTEGAMRLRVEAETPVPMPSPPAFQDPEPKEDDVTVKQEELVRQAEELARREEAVRASEAAFAEREATRRGVEDAAFVEGLVKAAQLPQGLVARTVALMAALPEAGVVSFAEGATTVEEAPHTAFRGLLEKLPKLVDFKERAPGSADAPMAEDAQGLARRALAYQDAQTKAGQSVSFAEAVQHVSTETR